MCQEAVIKTSRDKTNICKPDRHFAELINLMGREREREEVFLLSMQQVLPFTTLP